MTSLAASITASAEDRPPSTVTCLKGKSLRSSPQGSKTSMAPWTYAADSGSAARTSSSDPRIPAMRSMAETLPTASGRQFE